LKKWGIVKLFYKVNEKLMDPTELYFKSIIQAANNQDEKEMYKDDFFISIVVPVYNTNKKFLTEMIESVVNQTYQNWELCIADGGSTNDDVRITLEAYKLKGYRIKVVYLKNNEGISNNTNCAIEMAKGDYIVLLDHDDLLEYNALNEIAKCIRGSNPDIIYSDEDKISEDGNKRFEPHFKPDWSPALLLNYNYMCHLFCFNRKLISKVGKLRSEFDGSQDYDFILRCTEVTSKIEHIDKILYHWRMSKNSTASNINNKKYAIDAGNRVLVDTLKRRNLLGNVGNGVFLGSYFINYMVEIKKTISVIVHFDSRNIADFNAFLDNIKVEFNSFVEVEVVVVNDSIIDLGNQKQSYDYVLASGDTYTEMINDALEKTSGEYVLLVSSSINVKTSGWLIDMYGVLQNKDSHLVGMKWLSKCGKISNVGYSISRDIGIKPVYEGINRHFDGYMGRLRVRQNVSAVSPKLILFKKSIIQRLGKLDSNFEGLDAWFDFYVRMRNYKYNIVLTPENIGIEESQIQNDIYYSKLEEKWGKQLKNKDPFFNKIFT